MFVRQKQNLVSFETEVALMLYERKRINLQKSKMLESNTRDVYEYLRTVEADGIKNKKMINQGKRECI